MGLREVCRTQDGRWPPVVFDSDLHPRLGRLQGRTYSHPAEGSDSLSKYGPASTGEINFAD
jgi:hypothetical protein